MSERVLNMNNVIYNSGSHQAVFSGSAAPHLGVKGKKKKVRKSSRDTEGRFQTKRANQAQPLCSPLSLALVAPSNCWVDL